MPGFELTGSVMKPQVFFGTPHRGSSTRSFHSVVHSIIEANFTNVLGDWFPETLDALCQHIENINEQFRRICHNFSIINYYERPSLFKFDATSFRAVSPYLPTAYLAASSPRPFLR